MERKDVNAAIALILNKAVGDVGGARGIHLMDIARVRAEIIGVVDEAMDENVAEAYTRGCEIGREAA
jgi:hypothetical protein